MFAGQLHCDSSDHRTVIDKPGVMAVSAKHVYFGSRNGGSAPPSYLQRIPR